MLQVVKVTKNADQFKYSYSGYGIGFDSRSLFSIPNFVWGKNVIFGVENGSSVHIDNKIIRYIYIYIYMFWPSPDSSVWLGLTSREQLMSPECSKHQSSQWINSEHIYPIQSIIYIYIHTHIYIYI